MSVPFALIIEDHKDSAFIFGEALKAAGFEIEIVHLGDLALERLAATTPDVVVLDLHLPRVGGPDILHRIRTDARLAKTRVIVATAHPQMSERLQDDADVTLIKPVSFTQLRDLAARLLPE
jgi:CheY-like chemotaxis protein